MKPNVILFDFYNTLLEIRTDEHHPDVWAGLSRFLIYQGVDLEPLQFHDDFFSRIKRTQRDSEQNYPEIDMKKIFGALLRARGYNGPESLYTQTAQLLRALSIRTFDLFPDTLPVLERLRGSFKLGIISDCQRVFLEPEMQQVGLADAFEVCIATSDHGFRKPDQRLFNMALEQLAAEPEEAVFVGDNAYRDVCGARMAGITSVLLRRHEFWEKPSCHCDPDHTFFSLTEFSSWLRTGSNLPKR